MVVFLNLQGKPQLLTLDKERREKDKDMTREKGKRKRMGDLRREESPGLVPPAALRQSAHSTQPKWRGVICRAVPALALHNVTSCYSPCRMLGHCFSQAYADHSSRRQGMSVDSRVEERQAAEKEREEKTSTKCITRYRANEFTRSENYRARLNLGEITRAPYLPDPSQGQVLSKRFHRDRLIQGELHTGTDLTSSIPPRDKDRPEGRVWQDARSVVLISLVDVSLARPNTPRLISSATFENSRQTS
ncbi:hypothetical protein RRG08_051714 [Elysia crispata]|uniref:Uncharacterized protein n=1 Tax=Elysia crispata TaxID=231223 RepID=A0AAE1BAV4_9GAST|nr:hypothetical protein RRG08_051714 [Elysia crispata]